MNTPVDFKALAQHLAREQGLVGMLPVIEKELLHYEILHTLDDAHVLEHLVFQGGTCLRLCYGSERYSEDLDFISGPSFNQSLFSTIKSSLESRLPRRYAVHVEVKSPEAMSFVQDKRMSGKDRTVEVRRWRINIDTAPSRPDIALQRIKLEIAEVAWYTRQVKALAVNYSELPTSYEDTLIFVESLEEIAADKLLSLATAPYIRHRDIWDLRWISLRPHLDKSSISGLLKRKVIDYGETAGFEQSVKNLLERLPAIVDSNDFVNQMRRFLPEERISKTLIREAFRVNLVDEITELYGLAP